MLRGFWSKVGSIGLDKLKDPNEERNVILVNRISVVLALACFGIICLFFIGLSGRGWTLTRQLILLMGVFFLATPILNYYGKFLLAKLIISWAPLLFIISITVYDKILLPEYYSLKDFFYYKFMAFTCSVFPFLIFNSRQRLHIIFSLLPSFVILAFGDQVHDYFGVGLSDFGYEVKHPFVFAMLTLVAYFLILVFVYNLRSVSDRFQQKVDDQNAILAENNAEIIAQSEELTMGNESLAEANQVIEEQNKVLGELVEEKTASLKNANDQLVLQNNELSQFSFTVSHKLKSPIATIAGLLSLLDKNSMTAENLELIGHIEDSCNSMDELFHELNEILSLRSELSQKYSEVDLREYFDELVKKVKKGGTVGDLDIELEDNTQNGIVFTNKTKFDSILNHLVSNAIKYRSISRSPKIRIKIVEGENGYLLSVWDNGLGMDLDTYSEKIFGMFQRFHTHTNGKGLGLYLVKVQAESMGGTASASSKLDEFTQIEVTFNKSLS